MEALRLALRGAAGTEHHAAVDGIVSMLTDEWIGSLQQYKQLYEQQHELYKKFAREAPKICGAARTPPPRNAAKFRGVEDPPPKRGGSGGGGSAQEK